MDAIQRTPIEAAAQAGGARFETREGWLRPVFPRQAGDLWLADETGRGTILIQGAAGAAALGGLGLDAPVAVGKGERRGELAVYRLRPDQLLVLTPAGGAAGTLSTLVAAAGATGDLITVTDLSHGRAHLLLAGAAAREALGGICALDLRDDAFPNNAARQTSVAKTTQLVIRDDLPDGTLAYWIVGARSLAAYLWDALSRSL